MSDYAKMSDRELDAAVAEKVMGYQQHLCMADCWTHETFFKGFRQKHYFTPSADIAAAWEVVEKMQDHSPLINLTKAQQWHCCLTPQGTPPDVWDDEEGWVRVGKRFHAYAESAPRAICLAALAAIEAKEPPHA